MANDRTGFRTLGQRVAIVVTLALALAGMWWIAVATRSTPEPTKTKPTKPEPTKDYLRIARNSEENGELAKNMRSVHTTLQNTVSQSDYDDLLPIYCEYVTRLVPYYYSPEKLIDLGHKLDPLMAEKPLLRILRGKDPLQMGSAAFLAASCKLTNATPYLIELVTTRFAGTKYPSIQACYTITEIFAALGRLAFFGDKKAADFLMSHSRVDAWRDMSFTVTGRDSTQASTFVWECLVARLEFYPSVDTITALRESGYRHAGMIEKQIRAFWASGDSIEQYYNELIERPDISSKYLRQAGGAKRASAATSIGSDQSDGFVIHETIDPDRLRNLASVGVSVDDAGFLDAYLATNWIADSAVKCRSVVSNWVPEFAMFGFTNLIERREGEYRMGKKDSYYALDMTNVVDGFIGVKVVEGQDALDARKVLLKALAKFYPLIVYPEETERIRVGDKCFLGSPTNRCSNIMFVRNNVYVNVYDKTLGNSSKARRLAMGLDQEIMRLSIPKKPDAEPDRNSSDQ